MSKSALVKIGVPPEQAAGIRSVRRIKQIIEQHDAAIARLAATTNERIREAMNDDASVESVPDDTDPQSAAAH